tara:strand:- start:1283 stop:1492 length:210 start_codon:yes stop_codon:yes gene_type:complete
MSIKDDTHDKLTKAYLEYFKEVTLFEKHGGERTMQSSRKWLREIRTLAKIRMDEIKSGFDAKKEARKKS